MLARHAIFVAIMGGCLGMICFNSAVAATPEEALQTTVDCQFDQTPLKDITDFIAKVHKVPIKLDTGVDGKTSVTVKYSGTMKGMLDKVLPSHGLEYITDKTDIVIRKKKNEK